MKTDRATDVSVRVWIPKTTLNEYGEVFMTKTNFSFQRRYLAATLRNMFVQEVSHLSAGLKK